MLTRILRLLLERRLFRLGQRTGTLVEKSDWGPEWGPVDHVRFRHAPSGNEPFDDPAHFGDMPLVVHSDGGDWGGWVHEAADTNQNG